MSRPPDSRSRAPQRPPAPPAPPAHRPGGTPPEDTLPGGTLPTDAAPAAARLGGRRAAPRAAGVVALLLAAVLAAVLAAGCGADAPPPTSPLGDGGAGSAGEAAPGGGAVPGGGALPPLPAPGDGAGGDAAPDGVPSEAALEAAAARALGTIAEVLGVPEPSLRLVALEPVAWPDACIGIDRPGLLCAQVVTPGWRAVVADGLGNPHTVHGDWEGQVAWAGERRVTGTLVAIDVAAGRVTVTRDEGGEETFALAPGSAWFGWPEGGPPPPSAQGTAVVVAADAAPLEDAPAVLAWAAAAE